MVDVTEGIYDVGTVSIENGSDQLIGTGTFWLATGERFDEVYVAGQRVLVKSIDADGVATLAMPWDQPDVVDGPYVWSFRSQLRLDATQTQAKIRDLITFYKMGGVRGTRPVSDAADTIVVDDLNKAIVYKRATPIAVSIAQAGADGKFVDGWATWVKNDGDGLVTITPVVSTINGGSILELSSGAAAFLWSHDGEYLAAVYAKTGGIAIGAAGPLAGRSEFNAEAPGFTYFASDTELLYVRLTSGGWSSGTAVIGAEGNDGWAPILSIVADGARRVARVVDWTGGTGPKPVIGKYVGPAGFVDNVVDGTNVRGTPGDIGLPGPANSLEIGTVTGGPTAHAEITGEAPAQFLNLTLPSGEDGIDGWSPVFSIVTDSARRVLRVIDWVGGEGTKPATGKYVGAAGLVDVIGDGIDIRGPVGAAGAGSGDMEKSIYDPDDDGKLANAQLEAMAEATVKMRRPGTGTGDPTDTTLADLKTDLALNNVNNAAQIPLSYLDTDAALTANSDTKVASQKAVKSAIATAIANLIGSAPGALDTLNELADALGDDPAFATTVTNALATKLASANNLSDLQNASTALTNLGLSANGKAFATAANYAAMKVLLALNNVDNTSDATKNSAAATLTNKVISAKDNSITGVPDDSNAAAGQIGEYMVNKNTAGVSLASGVTQNIVQVTLTAGDWDCRTSMRYFSAGGATITNQHTIIADQSATIPDYDHGIDVSCNPNVAGDVGGFMCGPFRYSVATGQTKIVYGIARCTYASGTITVKGIIEARRVR